MTAGHQHLARACTGLLVGVLSLATLAAALRARHLLGFEWDFFDGETVNTVFGRRVVETGSPYGSLTPDAISFPIYTPGYFWAIGPLQAVWPGSLWPQRTLSLAATALTALFVAGTVSRLGGARRHAIVGALALFTAVSVSTLATAVRPDPLAITFIAAALWCVTGWERDQRRRQLFSAAGLCVGVLLLKQNFGVMVLALLAAVALRDRRAAAWFGATVVAGTAALYAFAQLTSAGRFTENVGDFSATGYSLGALRGVLEANLLPIPNPIVVVGAVVAVVGLHAKRDVRAAVLVWFASLTVVASAIKLGSAVNYWVATDWASAVLVGMGLYRLEEASRPKVAASGMAALSLLLAPGALNSLVMASGTGDQVAAIERDNAAAVERLRSYGRGAFAMRPDIAVTAGLGPQYDPSVMAAMAHAGRWDPVPLAARISRREFTAVLTMYDLRGAVPGYQGVPILPTVMVTALRRHYCPRWHASAPSNVGRLWLWAPCSR